MPQRPNNIIRELRPHQRLWRNERVDQNLQDSWLERLNRLACFRLVSICEGHATRVSSNLNPRPHLNLNVEAAILERVIANWKHVSFLLEVELNRIFSGDATNISFELTARVSAPVMFNFVGRDKIVVRVDCNRHRETEGMEGWTVEWFEDVIQKVELLDATFSNIVKPLASYKPSFDVPLVFTEGSFIKHAGATRSPLVLVDAIHAVKPRSDAYTGRMAEKIARQTGCHCIISTVSRTVADINRPPNGSNDAAIAEYRQTIHSMLRCRNILTPGGNMRFPFLHISLHGMIDRDYADIEIGTVHGRSSSHNYTRWFENKLKAWADTLEGAQRRPAIKTNVRKSGDPSKAFHRNGDPIDKQYRGYGSSYNSIQLEVARWLREGHRKELIAVLCDIINEFNATCTLGG